MTGKRTEGGRLGPRQRGLTLLELLVAATIGSVIIAGSLSLYVNVLESANFQNSSSLVQENGRFAIDHLVRILRMARYSDPVDDDPVGLDIPSKWLTGINSAQANARLQSRLHSPTGLSPKMASDAIEVTYQGASSAAGLAVDCTGAAVSPAQWVTNIFLVTTSDELLCFSFREPDGLIAGPHVVAEGIEDLQLRYGLDGDGDGVPDRYWEHNGLGANDWPDVVAVKVALLVNSVHDAGGETMDNLFVGTIHSCTSCDPEFFPNPPADRLVRADFHTTVRIRTR